MLRNCRNSTTSKTWGRRQPWSKNPQSLFRSGFPYSHSFGVHFGEDELSAFEVVVHIQECAVREGDTLFQQQQSPHQHHCKTLKTSDDWTSLGGKCLWHWPSKPLKSISGTAWVIFLTLIDSTYIWFSSRFKLTPHCKLLIRLWPYSPLSSPTQPQCSSSSKEKFPQRMDFSFSSLVNEFLVTKPGHADKDCSLNILNKSQYSNNWHVVKYTQWLHTKICCCILG